MNVNYVRLQPDIVGTGRFNNALNRAASRVAEEIIQKAREVYAKKRVTRDPTSLVIDSMTYNIKSSPDLSVFLQVFCDGVKAPHARWVEWPRRFRNGRMFPGYFFMGEGGKHGKTLAPKILLQELRKR